MSDRYKSSMIGAGLGIVSNLFLVVIKGLAGFFANSTAMMADALHSAADIFASMAVIIGIKVARKPADEEHPYGHWKAETIASKIIALVIILGGLNIALSSFRVIVQGVEVVPGSLALWAAVISIVIKELIFRYTYRVGRKVNSMALVANAWHHRSDALTSVAALVGIGGARIGDWLGYPQFLYMDPLAGLLVSLFILRMGWKLAGEATFELMDAVVSGQELRQITEIVSCVSGVEEVHDVKARCSGPYILVDLRIGVRHDLTVKEGHEICRQVKVLLQGEKDNVLEVIVHVNPCHVS